MQNDALMSYRGRPYGADGRQDFLREHQRPAGLQQADTRLISRGLVFKNPGRQAGGGGWSGCWYYLDKLELLCSRNETRGGRRPLQFSRETGKPRLYYHSHMKRVVHAACPHDCPDACGVLITIEDGRATRIQGDPEHPVTRGFLCAKVAKYLDRVYSPERVLYPMRRVVPKGPAAYAGEGARATLERSCAPLDGRMRPSLRKPGSASPGTRRSTKLRIACAGSLPNTAANPSCPTLTEARWARSTALPWTAVSSTAWALRNWSAASAPRAGEEGLKSVIGIKLGTEPEQFAHSRYIIAWGSNIHGNNVHLWPFIEEARRKGAKLVVIDPYRTRTAKCADWYLPINPGTDAALALGLMHVIINENLFDADYVSRYTVGFEDLKARAQQYPPEKVALLDRHIRRRYSQACPRVRHRAAVRDSRQLRHPALGARRHVDARGHHAALFDRVVEGGRRRTPALAQRRFRFE